jgi:hypothetical protein
MPIVLQTDASDFFRGVALPLAGLFAFAVVGWFAVIAVRKAFRGEEHGAEAFTLDELRRLHRAGELSDEEFARAKEAMLGIARRAKAEDAGPPAARRTPPVRDGGEPVAGSPLPAASRAEPQPPTEPDRSSVAPPSSGAPLSTGVPRQAPVRPAALDAPPTPRSAPPSDS